MTDRYLTAGHTGCKWRRVGTPSDLALEIRTIAVSARAAIDGSYKVGRPDVAAECAWRGLTMLEGIRDRLGGDVPDEIQQLYEAAHRELTSAMGAAEGGTN
jgi:hypothetical protein